MRAWLHVEPSAHPYQSEHGRPAEGASPDGQPVLLRRLVHAPTRSRHGRDRRAERGRGLLHGQGSGRAVRRDDPRDRARNRQRRACRTRPPAVRDLLPALPRRPGRRQGDPVSTRQRPHRLLPPGQDPEVPGRADLRRHHERVRADVRLPLADPSRGQVGDHRSRARARAQAAGKTMKNRKLLVLIGPVLGILMFVATWQMASSLMKREYRDPYRAAVASVDQTPRVAGQADEATAALKQAQDKPYKEAEYRTFPLVGSRVAIWMVAQLHLLFAAFVLAVPIFAFIVEAIGYKTGDPRYDRLAHEVTKLLSVSFSLTATFGAALTFMLIILYPKFTNYMMSVFSPTFLPYVLLFFFEAFFLYTYYYGWGKLHPLVHLGLGLGLNLVGTTIMMSAKAWP